MLSHGQICGALLNANTWYHPMILHCTCRGCWMRKEVVVWISILMREEGWNKTEIKAEQSTDEMSAPDDRGDNQWNK